MRHGEWDLWEEDASAPSASFSPPAEVDPLDELAKKIIVLSPICALTRSCAAKHCGS